MAVLVNGRRLKTELDRRGLTNREFAQRVPCAPNTVTAAMAGKPIQQSVLARMALVLQNTPTIAQIDELIADRAGSAA